MILVLICVYIYIYVIINLHNTYIHILYVIYIYIHVLKKCVCVYICIYIHMRKWRNLRQLDVAKQVPIFYRTQPIHCKTIRKKTKKDNHVMYMTPPSIKIPRLPATGPRPVRVGWTDHVGGTGLDGASGRRRVAVKKGLPGGGDTSPYWC